MAGERRIRQVSLGGIAAAILALGFFAFILRADKRPAFVAGQPAKATVYTNLYYPFFISAQQGLIWVEATAGNGHPEYWIVDVERGTVLGEVRNMRPVLLDKTRGKCIGRVSNYPVGPVRRFVYRVLESVSGGRVNLRDEDSFWSVDLQGGESAFLGTHDRSSSDWETVPGPGVNRAYALQKMLPTGAQYALFDLEANSMSVETVPGWLYGWWSANELVCKVSNDYLLYDLTRKTTRPLLTRSDLKEWLESNRLDEPPSAAFILPAWMGRDYRFFVLNLHLASRGSSYLAALHEQPEGLHLLADQFEFNGAIGTRFDPTGQWYASAGLGWSNSSAVFLRNIETKELRTVFPQDGKYQSLPAFCGSSLVCIRSNAVWKVDLETTRMVRLFPP